MTHLSVVARRTELFPVPANRAPAHEPPADFFAGVSSQCARERDMPSNIHAPEKVFAEVGLFLAVVSVFVATVCWLVPVA